MSQTQTISETTCEPSYTSEKNETQTNIYEWIKWFGIHLKLKLKLLKNNNNAEILQKINTILKITTNTHKSNPFRNYILGEQFYECKKLLHNFLCKLDFPVLCKKLYALDKKDNRLYLVKNLALQSDQNVFLCFDKNNDKYYVIKWLSHNYKKTIQYEIDMIQKMVEHGASLYKFQTSVKFWGLPVLCMEYLKPLSINENKYKVGIHILKLLKVLHKFGVHNGLKIDNIMKSDKRIYLIDYGDITATKLKHGYHRKCYVKNYASQQSRSSSHVVTTPKNDFIELGYVMNALDLRRNGHNQTRKLIIDTDSNLDILPYMSAVNAIDDYNISANIHDVLIKILYKSI